MVGHVCDACKDGRHTECENYISGTGMINPPACTCCCNIPERHRRSKEARDSADKEIIDQMDPDKNDEGDEPLYGEGWIGHSHTKDNPESSGATRYGCTVTSCQEFSDLSECLGYAPKILFEINPNDSNEDEEPEERVSSDEYAPNYDIYPESGIHELGKDMVWNVDINEDEYQYLGHSVSLTTSLSDLHPNRGELTMMDLTNHIENVVSTNTKLLEELDKKLDSVKSNGPRLTLPKKPTIPTDTSEMKKTLIKLSSKVERQNVKLIEMLSDIDNLG